MNLKIENKYLDIMNYPHVEKHFQSMASKGWLISKIIAGSLFVYKRIQPQELDFSVSPYEAETAFTRKSKKEIQEFESTCESVGWNYATKSYNLHIYYKEKDSDALDIHTDLEEEFELLERMGKNQIKSYYSLIVMFAFLSWFIIGGMATSVYDMKNGLSQTVALLLPLQVILNITQAIHTKKFLKINKKNIEMGKEIEYSNSKFYFIRINFALASLVMIAFVIYIFYAGVFLRNKIMLIALIPGIIGLIVGGLYRIFIKPTKFTKKYKIIIFGVTILVVIVATSTVSILGIGSISGLVGNDTVPNRDEYRVLLRSDFTSTSEETEGGTLMENISILIPKSYEYISRGTNGDGIRYIETQYAKALTKGIAHELVNRYKYEAVKHLQGSYYPDLEYSYQSGSLEEILIDHGLSQVDFDCLKEKDLKQAIKESVEIIKENTLEKANLGLWNADEAYFLSNDKHEIVLRKGKEVFMLRGIDFTDPEAVRGAKESLGL